MASSTRTRHPSASCSPARGSVTKRWRADHGSAGARERRVTWPGLRVLPIGFTSGRREQDQRRAQASPAAPLPLRVPISATACRAVRSPHLVMAPRIPQCSVSSRLAPRGGLSRCGGGDAPQASGGLSPVLPALEAARSVPGIAAHRAKRFRISWRYCGADSPCRLGRKW